MSMDEADVVTATTKRIINGGFNPHTSSWDHKVCVMLHNAQGIIDNGGFEYFFESRFQLDPGMNDFVAVYQAVGAITSAKAVEEALARSRSSEPDYDDLNKILWRESESNYDLLTAYIALHSDSYK